MFLCGGACLKNASILPADHINRFVLNKPSDEYLVRGTVESVPEQKASKSVFVLQANTVALAGNNYRCTGNILVRFDGIKPIGYSQQLLLSGKFILPYAYFRQGLSPGSAILILNASRIQPIELRRRFSLAVFSSDLKNRLSAIYSRYLSRLSAGVTKAMVLGERKDIPPLLNSIMMRTGTVHILVVSGFNVGLIAFIASLGLKTARLSRKARLYLIIPCLGFYCLLTGGSNPVLRATIMAVVMIVSQLVQRTANIYNALAIAAFLILVFRPAQLFDIGFQLSFASVASICLLYPKISGFLKTTQVKFRPWRFALEGFAVSLSAWLGTTGIIAYYFKTVPLIAVIANILVVPLAALITILGLCLIFFSAICPQAAGCLASLCNLAAYALVWVNTAFSRLPGSCLDLS